jgi:hypothetical protein
VDGKLTYCLNILFSKQNNISPLVLAPWRQHNKNYPIHNRNLTVGILISIVIEARPPSLSELCLSLSLVATRNVASCPCPQPLAPPAFTITARSGYHGCTQVHASCGKLNGATPPFQFLFPKEEFSVSRDSVVGIATSYGLNDRGVGV